MAEPTRDDLTRDLFRCMNETDRLIRALIVDELAGQLPGLEQAEAEAAAALQAAVADLEGPERALAELSAEIDRVGAGN